MNSHFSFLRRVRIHDGECGAVARALHHEAKISSPAVIENVSVTTFERKEMTNKSTFKRIALGVVVALGLSFFSTAPASAANSNFTLALSGSGITGNTASVNESATAVTATTSWFASAASDSAIIRASVVGPGTATVSFRATSDSSNVTYAQTGIINAGNDPVALRAETVTVSTGNAEAKAAFTVQASGFSAVGTYTITVSINSLGAGACVGAGTCNYTVEKYASYVVTVAAATGATATAIRTYTAAAPAAATSGGETATALYHKGRFAASSDSAVAVSAGVQSTTYSPVAVIFANLFNASSETVTGTAKSNICADTCTVTVIASGPVTLRVGAYATTATSSTAAKSATMTLHNGADKAGGAYSTSANPGAQAMGETLTVYTDGSGLAGTGTLTYYLASNNVVLGTSTVTLTGGPASVSQMYSNDTITYVGASTGTLNAIVKDSGGTTLKSGTIYLYSSDTKVAGSTSASAAAQSCTIGSTGIAACSFTVSDTGTATLTLRDSTTVALSTWVSAGWDVTVTGVVPKTDLTVAFDKATYAPGDRAVITITANDSKGNKIATVPGGITSLFTVASNKLTTGANGSSYVLGSQAYGTQGTTITDTSFLGYQDSGIETRVVTMPSYSGEVTYSLKFTAFGQTSGNVTEVVAKATVVDPNAAAIAAAQAASDAATDAANEAIDAANAATDAANLAAEAADAATVAAEEARDAADAATAAVEELATQVATLMAALKAQITTLANTVAKIAKKVKA